MTRKVSREALAFFVLFHGFAALGHYSSAEKMAVRIFTSEHTEQNARPRHRARQKIIRA
jgi:hypothetical protein